MGKVLDSEPQQWTLNTASGSLLVHFRGMYAHTTGSLSERAMHAFIEGLGTPRACQQSPVPTETGAQTHALVHIAAPNYLLHIITSNHA